MTTYRHCNNFSSTEQAADNSMKRVWLYILSWLFIVSASAQVTVVPEKKTIAPGQPLRVDVSVVHTQPAKALIGDTLGIFEILKKEEPNQQQKEGRYLWQQTLFITCFDSGRFVLPPVRAEDAAVQASEVDTILVQRMPPDSLKGYTDIRNYLPPSDSFNVGTTDVLIAIASILTLLFLWLLWRRRRKGRLPVEASITSKEKWEREWKQLQQQWQSGKLTHEQAAEYIMILSRALFALNGMATQSKTGAELVRSAQQHWQASHWQSFKTIVSYCYSIQFAKQQPEKQKLAEQIDALQHVAIQAFEQRS
jgi:hypothetical protein